MAKLIAGILHESEEELSKSPNDDETWWRNFEKMPWKRMRSYARDAVKPMGDSCNRIVIIGSDNVVEINQETAAVIRSRGEKDQIGEPAHFHVRVDGFTHHNRQVKITHPEKPGTFITGHVRDHAFREVPNIYTQAAAQKEFLLVWAEPVLSPKGELKALRIWDAKLP